MIRLAVSHKFSAASSKLWWRRAVIPSTSNSNGYANICEFARCKFLSSMPSWKVSITDTRAAALKRTYSSTLSCSQETKETVSITYVEADGNSKTVDAKVGADLMTTAHDHDIELEGACGGELSCSTCHLIFEQSIYDSLPEKEDEEDDMLDLAFEVRTPIAWG